ncbi:hypothetical protein M409DRAFT_29434 [Zasmidium cellare ATCC 36951]|uniref:Uncharacterized protein n=1 Tax=Zasmidium cellare ATCC 36951 TaxID=1080233 RepID=A0A6A6C318_ZASCE|nr:uncharacterized protein M409DRAFT_29434 [Zasmidium cellare ATCC 36951]KAF2160139.1 hypothetical protein M409DRAFT_29434 [Zasmidium cellare ATCC 36951]
MSAASRLPQAAHHAVKSTFGAAKDAAKKTFLPDGLKARHTPIVTTDNADGPYWRNNRTGRPTTDGLTSWTGNGSRQRSTSEGTPRSTYSPITHNRLPKQPSQPRPTNDPNALLRYLYDPYPNAINYTTFASTRAIAEDPYHPYHIRTRRRLEAFDPSKLHWRVHVPMDVSKKSAIRNWAKKRVRRAIERELERGGFETDGGVKDGGEGEGMRGALLVILSKDPKAALPFTDEQVKGDVATLLESVRERQRRGQRLGHSVAGLRQRSPVVGLAIGEPFPSDA